MAPQDRNTANESSFTLLPQDEKKLFPIIDKMKDLANQYYKLTERPIGITGEVGEIELIHYLGLKPGKVREKCLDAMDGKHKIQIKTRRLHSKFKLSQKTGKIRIDEPWDCVYLALLGADYNARWIFNADWERVNEILSPQRHDISISTFITISKQFCIPKKGEKWGLKDCTEEYDAKYFRKEIRQYCAGLLRQER